MKLLLIALSMLFVLPAPVSSVGFIGGADGPTEAFVTPPDTANTSIAIIGGADGPTDVFVTTPDTADTNIAIIGGADGPTDIFAVSPDEADALTVIGGAGGPTAVFISGSPRFLLALCGFLDILFANAGR